MSFRSSHLQWRGVVKWKEMRRRSLMDQYETHGRGSKEWEKVNNSGLAIERADGARAVVGDSTVVVAAMLLMVSSTMK